MNQHDLLFVNACQPASAGSKLAFPCLPGYKFLRIHLNAAKGMVMASKLF